MSESKPNAATPSGKTIDSLRMSDAAAMELANRATQLILDWNNELRKNSAWEGDFRQILQDEFIADPPEQGRPAMEVLEQTANRVLATAARHAHPRFFAFIPSSITWPGILAEFLTAGYNINACTWLSASGPSQIELTVIEWFCRWVGFPESAGGLFTSGGSAASLEALVAARESAGSPQNSTVYISDQCHSSIPRAAMIIGIKRDFIRRVKSDDQFRFDRNALAGAIRADKEAGLVPLAVCASAGTSSTGAIDPLDQLADFCESEEIWLHVDAAYGGFAIVTEQGRELLKGMERADSISLDAHKWFFQPYEAGCLLMKNLNKIEQPFRMKHDVLQDTVWGTNHPNMADRGLQLSRSFRALKVWMSVQTFGMAAFRAAILSGLTLATKAGDYVVESDRLELLTPVSLGIVCFRVNPAELTLSEETLEEINRNVLTRVFWEDHALISSTSLRETFSLRLCILNWETSWDDVRETLETIEQFGAEALPTQDQKAS